MSHKAKKPESICSGTVRLPRFVFWIGAVCTAIMSIPTVVCWQNQMTAHFIIFLFACLVGVILMAGYQNSVITYDEEGFTHRNLFRKQRHYTYAEVTGIRGSRDTRIYLGDRSVLVDELAEGRWNFLCQVRRQYRIRHQGNPLPQLPPRRWDIFHGHVDNPGEFIFIYILLYVSILGIEIYVLSTLLLPLTPQNTEYCSTSFARYEIIENELHLYPAGSEEYYEIRDVQGCGETAEQLKALCGSGSQFQIYSTYYTPNSGSYYLVANIADANGKTYFTFDQANAQRRQSAADIALLFSVFLLLWTFFVSASIVVGRNPQKHKRAVKWFFKDGYVH